MDTWTNVFVHYGIPIKTFYQIHTPWWNLKQEALQLPVFWDLNTIIVLTDSVVLTAATYLTDSPYWHALLFVIYDLKGKMQSPP